MISKHLFTNAIRTLKSFLRQWFLSLRQAHRAMIANPLTVELTALPWIQEAGIPENVEKS